MTTLRHAVNIAAPRPTVFGAISEPTRMQPWHLGTVEGGFGLGEEVRLVSRPGLSFTWRTDAIEPGSGFAQTCLAGPGSSAGKTLRFEVADAGDGRTRVSLAHAGWDADDPELPFCNTYWGEALARLRDHLEQA